LFSSAEALRAGLPLRKQDLRDGVIPTTASPSRSAGASRQAVAIPRQAGRQLLAPRAPTMTAQQHWPSAKAILMRATEQIPWGGLLIDGLSIVATFRFAFVVHCVVACITACRDGLREHCVGGRWHPAWPDLVSAQGRCPLRSPAFLGDPGGTGGRFGCVSDRARALGQVARRPAFRSIA
jgi:hypothetical protein